MFLSKPLPTLEKCPICDEKPEIKRVRRRLLRFLSWWQVVCPNDKFNVVGRRKRRLLKEWNRIVADIVANSPQETINKEDLCS